MAHKRGATTDLNHTNWNDEEEPEPPSDFKFASADVMAKRPLKRGKRRLAGSTAPAASTPFSNFSFGAGNVAPTSKPTFSFSSSPSTTNPPVNGSSAKDKTEDTDDKQSVYLAKLKGLNEEVISWLKSSMEKNPFCDFTPVFEDYDSYLKRIRTERDSSSEKSTTESKPASTSQFAGFKFLPPSASAPSIASPPSAKSEKEPDAPAKSSIFGSSKPAESKGFSFGSVKPPTFPTSTPVFGMFGGTSASSGPKVPTSDDGTAEDESEEPPKNDFKPVTEDDAVFSQRVKVFVKKETDGYADRGVGTLFIKPANDKYQTIVRADTSLGNLLLNIILSDSMPIKRLEKNNVLIVCVPLPADNAKPVPTLLRVKTSEEADKLFEELNKYKKPQSS